MDGTLHADGNTFVVVEGHELPDVETVVDGTNGYLIVRKHADRD